eukprot:403340539
MNIYYNPDFKQIHIRPPQISQDEMGKKYILKNEQTVCEQGKKFIANDRTSLYELVVSHSDICPNRSFRKRCLENNVDPVPISVRNTNLAVCSLIFDKDDNLLLTRRQARLHFFPRAWVAAGGGVELGEQLEIACLRELEEETGIKIDAIPFKQKLDGPIKYNRFHFEYQNEPVIEFYPYYAFESASYKDNMSYAPARSTHLIMFYVLKINKHKDEIGLRLQYTEVDYGAWLSKEDTLEMLAHKTKDEVIQGFKPKDRSGEVVPCEINKNQIMQLYTIEKGEGIGKAHFMALDYYFNTFLT